MSATALYRGNLAHYLNVGLSAIDAIDHALSKKNAAKEVVSVLDLPCGYGRVTRTLRCRFPSAQFTVCDLEKKVSEIFARARLMLEGALNKKNLTL